MGDSEAGKVSNRKLARFAAVPLLETPKERLNPKFLTWRLMTSSGNGYSKRLPRLFSVGYLSILATSIKIGIDNMALR